MSKSAWKRSELPSGSFFLEDDKCAVRVMSKDRRDPYDTKSNRGWSWSLWKGPEKQRGLWRSGETRTLKAAKAAGQKAFKTCAR